jgi:hypothetical protein
MTAKGYKMRERKRLRFWQALLPIYLSSGTSPKRVVNVYEEIVKKVNSAVRIF